jgi:RimJ/RimL family protein N-acetyltransferase
MAFFRADPEELAETPRLVLRWPRRDDVYPLVPLLNDWDVARWLANVPYPFSASDARDWIRVSQFCRRGRRVYVVVVARREDGVPIGGAELNLDRRETGYWIGTRHQGQGYGKELLAALLRLAFVEHGLPDLTAATLPDNLRSRALLESAGFILRGVEPFDFGLRGGFQPGCIHSLTAGRWRSFNGDPA